MTIHLSGQREQLILSLLQAGKFASADELIDEALRLVGQRYQEPGAVDHHESGVVDRTGQQLDNLRRLGQKLEAMPTAPVTDGLTNRDHDRILYGP